MKNKKDVLSQVRNLIKKSVVLEVELGKAREYFSAQEKIWEEIMGLDKSLGEGLKIGRFVSWPVADGQACYFVTGFDEKIAQLEHIPLGDAYHSPVVSSGVALTSAVKLAISRQDALRILFAKE